MDTITPEDRTAVGQCSGLKCTSSQEGQRGAETETERWWGGRRGRRGLARDPRRERAAGGGREGVLTGHDRLGPAGDLWVWAGVLPAQGEDDRHDQIAVLETDHPAAVGSEGPARLRQSPELDGGVAAVGGEPGGVEGIVGGGA